MNLNSFRSEFVSKTTHLIEDCLLDIKQHPKTKEGSNSEDENTKEEIIVELVSYTNLISAVSAGLDSHVKMLSQMKVVDLLHKLVSIHILNSYGSPKLMSLKYTMQFC